MLRVYLTTVPDATNAPVCDAYQALSSSGSVSAFAAESYRLEPDDDPLMPLGLMTHL